MAENQDDYDVKYQRFLEKIGATPTKIIRTRVKVNTSTEVKQNEEECINNQRLASAQHQLKTVVIHNVEPRKLNVKFNEMECGLQRAETSEDLREQINQEGNHFQIEMAPKILEGQSQEQIQEQNYQRIMENTQGQDAQPINYKQEHPKLETVQENDFNESNESHSPNQDYFNQFQNQSEIVNQNEIQLKLSPLAKVIEHEQDNLINQEQQLAQLQNENNQIIEQLKLETQIENNIIEQLSDSSSINQLDIVQEQQQQEQEVYKKVEEEQEQEQQQQLYQVFEQYEQEQQEQQEQEQQEQQQYEQQEQEYEQEQELEQQLQVQIPVEYQNQNPEVNKMVDVQCSPIMEIEIDQEPEQNDFDKQNIQSQVTVINQQQGINKECIELSEFKESSISPQSKIMEVQAKKIVLPKIRKNIVKPIKKVVEKQAINPLNVLFEQFVGKIQNKIIPVNWKKQPLLLRKIQKKRNILRLAKC